MVLPEKKQYTNTPNRTRWRRGGVSDSKTTRRSRGVHNVKVEPQSTVMEENPLHQTVDSRFRDKYKNPYERGSGNVDNVKKEPKRSNGGNEAGTNSAKDQRKRQVQKPSRNKIKERSTTKKVYKTAKVGFAVLTTIGICFGFFIAQLAFWIFAIAGLGLEAGALSLGDLQGGNFLTRALANLLSTIVPGDHMFIIGWVMSSVLALIQLFISLSIFYIYRINALSGENIKNFGIIFALCFLPLGLIPWVLFWIYSVIKSELRK